MCFLPPLLVGFLYVPFHTSHTTSRQWYLYDSRDSIVTGTFSLFILLFQIYHFYHFHIAIRSLSFSVSFTRRIRVQVYKLSAILLLFPISFILRIDACILFLTQTLSFLLVAALFINIHHKEKDLLLPAYFLLFPPT